MADKIDIGTKETKEEIDVLIKKVVELSDEIAKVKKLPFKASDSGGFNKELEKTNKNLTELEKIEKQVIVKREKLALVTNKAYIENQKLTKSISEANSKIKENTKDTDNLKKSQKSLIGSMKNLLRSMLAFVGVRMFIQSIKDTFELTKKLDSLNFAMLAITKSQKAVAKTTQFLSRITKAYGAEIVSTTERYIRFLAAAKQSSVSLKDTENIFETFTKVSGVLGMNTQDLSGIFLALEQMMSKGKITTEELRRQLGERLPGAMGIMATSLGVTIPKLDEMLKKGQVLSAEALPEFARQVELSFGISSVKKVNTLSAAWNRLKNKWVEIFSEFSKSNNLTKILTSSLSLLTNNFADILKNVALATSAFISYKLIIESVSVSKLLLKKRSELLALQQVALSFGINKTTFAMARLNAVMKANIIGIVVVALTGIIWAIDKFSVSLEENVKAVNKSSREFIESSHKAEEVSDSINMMADSYDKLSKKVIENNQEQSNLTDKLKANEEEQNKLNKQIKKGEDVSGDLAEKLRVLHNEHIDLTDKTIKFKDEQEELDRVTKALGTSFKDTIVDENEYGDAKEINTVKVRKLNKELKEELLLKAEIKNRELTTNISDLKEKEEKALKRIKIIKEGIKRVNSLIDKEEDGFNRRAHKSYVRGEKVRLNSLNDTKNANKFLLVQSEQQLKANNDLIFAYSKEGIAKRKKDEEDAKIAAEEAASIKNIKNLTEKNNKLIEERKLLEFSKRKVVESNDKISIKTHKTRILEINKEIKANQKLIEQITGKKSTGGRRRDISNIKTPKITDDTSLKAEAEGLKTLVEARKNEIDLESTTNETRKKLAEENRDDLIAIANLLQMQKQVSLTNDAENQKNKLKDDLENAKNNGKLTVKLQENNVTQIAAIDKKLQNDLKISTEKGNQDRLDAKKWYADQSSKIEKKILDDAISLNKSQRDAQKVILIDEFNERVEIQNLTGDELKEAKRQLAIELLEEDIDFLEKQAKLYKDVDPEKYNALMLAIRKAREDLVPPDLLPPESNSKFKKWIDEQAEGLKKIGDLFGELANLSNAFTETELQNIEKQREALDEKHESDLEQLDENTEASLEAIALTDESAEEKADKADGIRNSADAEEKRLAKEKEKREELLAKKEAQIKTKQAKIDKSAALTKIAISTAIGIANALEKSFLGIPLVPIIAALGAVQAATVIATPIPKFAQGGTMTYDGDMMINDGGNKEYVERDGNILSTDKKDAVVKGKKGDIIHKDKNSLLNSFSDNILKASLMTSLSSDRNNINNTSELTDVFDRNFNKFEKSMANSVQKGIGKMIINNNNYSSDYANYKASLEQ